MNTTDLARLKQSIDLVAVVQSRGVKLVKQGKDFVGLCPFHKEKTPSFHVTPSKNLFNCLGCHVGGSVIDFIMRQDGLTKSQAVAWLKENSGATFTRPAVAPAAPARMLTPRDAEALLQRVVNFYARTLRKDETGLGYWQRRNLSGATLEAFRAGYANGTLHRALPKAGNVIQNLKTLGVLNAKGQEHFRGCVTVPIFDAAGNVSGIYGRRVSDAEPQHLYLPGPHRGVWNGTAAKINQTLFITEAILDGMSLWQAGFKNVVALYGAHGWTDDHAQLLRENNTTEIYLALDNDATGEEATARLKDEVLPLLAKKIHVVKWPEGVKDANEFFARAGQSTTDFEALLKAANPPDMAAPSQADRVDEKIEMAADGFIARYGSRSYQLRAIERQGASRLRATVKAVSGEAANAGRFHIDTVDFYLSRSRRMFIGEAARLFREGIEVTEADVNRLIVQVEAYAQKQLEGSQSQAVLVSETDKAEALKLGRHPDLAGEILRDMEKLGLIGEAGNKLIGYLTMTSRKMPDPLALLTLSGSGSGKSHLQDTILCLCPDEELIKLTSLTDRALFYKGEDSLKNKVLAVEELAGAAGADYAIRNLISAKKLVIESTIKNPLTGKLETQVNTVNGPTAVFQTTTNPRTDAETRSRFVVISVDESPEQTKAILAAQRQSHTREGWRQRLAREAILKRHQAFQRLLKPLKVINPFEPLLDYPEENLSVRRDQPKYLNLILAVTFLHQLQRPVHNDAELGDYIETTLADIAIANELAHELFGHSLDDLSRPGRELLRLIAGHVAGKSGSASGQKAEAGAATFNRRELREAFKWGDTRLRTHLDELVEMEYVVPLSGRFGQTYQYRLVYEPSDEPGRFLPGLKSVEQLRREAQLIGQPVAGVSRSPNLAGVLTHLAPQNGHLAPTSQVAIREVQNAVPANKNGRFVKPSGNLAPFLGKHIPEKHRNGGRP
ncbi:MAG: CHC2 zinc finger domain-containing protein [Verrucomicrobiia bacterium]